MSRPAQELVSPRNEAGSPTRRAGPRLPARPARRRAGVPGALRRCSRTPTSSRPSTTRGAPRGASQHRRVAHLVPAAPAARRRGRSAGYLPLYPYAMEALDLTGYDLVLSSSSAWAHGVLPSEDAVHVCYCHNPFRYAWNARDATLRAHGPVVRAGARRGAAALAPVGLDRRPARRPLHRQLARRRAGASRATSRARPTSSTRRSRSSASRPATPADHYVVLSELMPHKRIDLAVRAFNALRRPLVVVGDGPDARRLQRLAGPTVRFTGRVSDAEVARLLATARALVVTADRGVRDRRRRGAGRRPPGRRARRGRRHRVGGARAAPAPSTTSRRPQALAEAIAAFDPLSVDPADCVANAQRFSKAAFAAEIRANVDQALAAGPSPRGDRRRAARGLAIAGRRAA